MEECEFSCPFTTDDVDFDKIALLRSTYFERNNQTEEHENDTDESDNDDSYNPEDESNTDFDAAVLNVRGYDQSNISDLEKKLQSNADPVEREKVEKFLNGTCRCNQIHKEACSNLFSVNDMLEIRMENSALDYRDKETHANKLDLVILVQLRAFSTIEGTLKSTKKTKALEKQERKQGRTNFCLRGTRVCEKTFQFAHCISRKRYRRLYTLFKNEGVVEKQHGNTGRLPHNTVPLDNVKNVVAFIQNYAEQNALYLPGRWSTQFNMSVKLLPTSVTKKTVFLLYEKACEAKNIPNVSLPSFRKLWNQLCPEIVVMKPKSDLCNFCQKHFTSKARSASLSEEEKRELIAVLTAHLERVDTERALYRDQISTTMEALASYKSQDDRFTDCSTGLPSERKEYLFTHIREYCSDESKDLLCPEPENMTTTKRGRPKKVVQENHDVSTPPAKKRGRPPKQIDVENGVANSPENTTTTKRGRPKKVVQENHDVSTPPARKRGRPPKQINVENANSPPAKKASAKRGPKPKQ